MALAAAGRGPAGHHAEVEGIGTKVRRRIGREALRGLDSGRVCNAEREPRGAESDLAVPRGPRRDGKWRRCPAGLSATTLASVGDGVFGRAEALGGPGRGGQALRSTSSALQITAHRLAEQETAEPDPGEIPCERGVVGANAAGGPTTSVEATNRGVSTPVSKVWPTGPGDRRLSGSVVGRGGRSGVGEPAPRRIGSGPKSGQVESSLA